MTYPIERVTWVDSASIDAWHSLEELKRLTSEVYACVSVGYLVHETEDSIVVASTTGEQERLCSAMQIPKVAILRRELIDADHHQHETGP